MKVIQAQRYVELMILINFLRPKSILEIGVWNGTRAKQMCRWGAKYTGFDLFEEATKISDYEEKNSKKHCTLSEVSEFLTQKKVDHTLIKGNTRETLSCLGAVPTFDLAFIDGGHSVETIASDWRHVRRMMKPDGLVVFDDYYIGNIDTRRWGANETVEKLPYTLSVTVDPIQKGGECRLAYVKMEDL